MSSLRQEIALSIIGVVPSAHIGVDHLGLLTCSVIADGRDSISVFSFSEPADAIISEGHARSRWWYGLDSQTESVCVGLGKLTFSIATNRIK